MQQKEIFMCGEGDEWFKRNQQAHTPMSADVELIRKYIARQERGNVLEIGCADGAKLNSYKGNWKGFGVDPSREAVASGQQKYPGLLLSVGTSDSMCFEDNTFDVVVFGFCLYLVDRSLLFRTVAEGDRLLKNGGFLIITDFDTPLPFKRIYHHKPGVYCYKQSYADLFLGNPSYSLVEKIAFNHTNHTFDENIQERVAISVLYKNVELAYVTG